MLNITCEFSIPAVIALVENIIGTAPFKPAQDIKNFSFFVYLKGDIRANTTAIRATIVIIIANILPLITTAFN